MFKQRLCTRKCDVTGLIKAVSIPSPLSQGHDNRKGGESDAILGGSLHYVAANERKGNLPHKQSPLSQT